MALNIPVPDFSNAKNLEEKFNILADSYFMLRKELEYTLQNLSSENFNSIFAKNITAKNVKGGTIEGVNFKGGNININDAFVVDGGGNVVMSGTLNIAGLITVDAEGNMTIRGGQMTWESSDPKLNDIDIELSNINGYLTDVNGQLIEIDGQLVGMNGDISDLSVVANLAGTNIVKLSNGTYLGGTFIDGKRIQAPEIYGGLISGIDIFGSSFYGDNENGSFLKIGAQNGDGLLLYSGDQQITFGVVELGSIVQFLVKDGSSVRVPLIFSDSDTTRPQGNWNFSAANVTGIVARFGS